MQSSFSPQAHTAKEKAKKAFPNAAVGLTWLNDQEAIKVNLSEALPSAHETPQSIDGFPIVLSVVGKIRKLPESET
jgi:hypothetical protein